MESYTSRESDIASGRAPTPRRVLAPTGASSIYPPHRRTATEPIGRTSTTLSESDYRSASSSFVDAEDPRSRSLGAVGPARPVRASLIPATIIETGSSPKNLQPNSPLSVSALSNNSGSTSGFAFEGVPLSADVSAWGLSVDAPPNSSPSLINGVVEQHQNSSPFTLVTMYQMGSGCVSEESEKIDSAPRKIAPKRRISSGLTRGLLRNSENSQSSTTTAPPPAKTPRARAVQGPLQKRQPSSSSRPKAKAVGGAKLSPGTTSGIPVSPRSVQLRTHRVAKTIRLLKRIARLCKWRVGFSGQILLQPARNPDFLLILKTGVVDVSCQNPHPLPLFRFAGPATFSELGALWGIGTSALCCNKVKVYGKSP